MVASGVRITVRARSDVFAHCGQAVVEFGQAFEVARRCIFVVWRGRRHRQRPPEPVLVLGRNST